MRSGILGKIRVFLERDTWVNGSKTLLNLVGIPRTGGDPGRITFGLTDHDVAELALPSFIEALHLNVIGGLRLQVADGVPVPVPWEGERGSLWLFIATDQHRRHRRIVW